MPRKLAVRALILLLASLGTGVALNVILTWLLVELGADDELLITQQGTKWSSTFRGVDDRGGQTGGQETLTQAVECWSVQMRVPDRGFVEASVSEALPSWGVDPIVLNEGDAGTMIITCESSLRQKVGGIYRGPDGLVPPNGEKLPSGFDGYSLLPAINGKTPSGRSTSVPRPLADRSIKIAAHLVAVGEETIECESSNTREAKCEVEGKQEDDDEKERPRSHVWVGKWEVGFRAESVGNNGFLRTTFPGVHRAHQAPAWKSVNGKKVHAVTDIRLVPIVVEEKFAWSRLVAQSVRILGFFVVPIWAAFWHMFITRRRRRLDRDGHGEAAGVHVPSVEEQRRVLRP